MAFILSDGAAIYYEEYGGGTPLILLPGLLGTIDNTWRRFVPELSAEYHTVVVDLRGHGRTNNPSGQLLINAMVNDLCKLIETLGFESVLICGYSLGGYLGLAYGLRNPQQVLALIMHGTKFFWTSEAADVAAREMDPDKLLARAPHRIESLRNDHPSPEGEERWRKLLRQAQGLITDMPSGGIPVSELRGAHFPVLVSAGDGDTLVPRKEVDDLARLLPSGRSRILPDTGHPMKTVHKDALLTMIREFFGTGLPDSKQISHQDVSDRRPKDT